jgi:integrase
LAAEPSQRRALSDAACRAAQPRDKPYKLSDAGGLFLFVAPSGSKLWRLKYRHAGREKLLSLGPYSAPGGGGLSLKEARARRDQAKAQLRDGIDPSTAKREAKADAVRAADNTLRAVAEEWQAKQAGAWSESHRERVRTFLERDVFPQLGARPVAAVTAPELLRLIEAIEARGALETARKVRQFLSQALRYAMRTRPEVQSNPADALRGALTRRTSKPYRHLTAEQLGPFLLKLRGYRSATTAAAIRLQLLAACRPGELRGARWQEFDLGTPGAELWTVPAERMKGRKRHLVPLSRQAAATLRELAAITRTAPDALLFRGLNDPREPMSDATMRAALDRLGADTTAHGFRHLFSTMANEQLLAPADVIERCLAHEPADRVRAAYNRAEHLDARRALLQSWADLLDSTEAEAKAGAASEAAH